MQIQNPSTGGDGTLFLFAVLRRHFSLLAVSAVVCGAAGFGIASFLPKTYTARTTFITPQSNGNSASNALSSLGALATIAGGSLPVRTQADQYATLMRSRRIQDEIIKKFDLQKIYEQERLSDTLKVLDRSTIIDVGKKDGIITIEVEDKDPQRAADISNEYVARLARLVSEFSLTDAQRRRTFFEQRYRETRSQISQAEQALQSAGFTREALQSEPRAAAESYAQLRTGVTEAEVNLSTLRSKFADNASEVEAAVQRLKALKTQLAKLESNQPVRDEPGTQYYRKYRELKYLEALGEFFGRQLEVARLDESNEQPAVQVVDAATAPDYKSGPKRLRIAALSMFIGTLAAFLWIISKILGKQVQREWTEAKTAAQHQ